MLLWLEHSKEKSMQKCLQGESSTSESNHSTVILNIAFVSLSCSILTIFLGSSKEALSHRTDTVRGHTKFVLRITMSWGLNRLSRWSPIPVMRNDSVPTMRSILTMAEFDLSLRLNASSKSAHALLAFTPIIQSPLSVRCSSLVI